MTLFLLGFISAIALMAILLIVYALKVYHRQEAHRQALAAKAPADQPDGFPPIYVGPMAKRPAPGKKGIH